MTGRVDWAYKASWLNGIQGPDGQMLRCEVKEVGSATLERTFDLLESGYCITSRANMIKILNHYEMAPDYNQSGQGFTIFRRAVDMNY